MQTEIPHEPAMIHRRMIVLCLAIASAFACFAGLGIKPLETHEIFVVQTAKEMKARNEWVVPYYNHEMRLTKPPLNYWLTRLVADVVNGGPVEAVHGRVPSAIAGIVFVLATWWLGTTLWSFNAGVLGGAFLLLSTGFLQYARNARPEMVYAALSATALAMFVQAWKNSDRASRWMSYGAWGLLGLACLSKGPHIPALIVVGLGVAILQHGGWRASLSTLRPFVGVGILVAIALPWMMLLRSRVGDFSQTAPELEGGRYMLEWWHVLDPFYLYKPLRLSLPWTPLLIGAIGLSRRDTPVRAGVRALLWVYLIVILGMSFGGHKRDYYLLPLLGVLASIASVSTLDAVKRISLASKRFPPKGPLAWEYGVGAVVLCITCLTALPATLGTSFATLTLVLGAIALCIGACFIRHKHHRVMAWLMAMGLSLGAIGVDQVFASTERASRRQAALSIDQWVPEGQSVHSYVDPAYAIFYSQRDVIDCTNPELKVPHQPGQWMFTSTPTPDNSYYPLLDKAVYTIRDCDNGKSWQLSMIKK